MRQFSFLPAKCLPHVPQSDVFITQLFEGYFRHPTHLHSVPLLISCDSSHLSPFQHLLSAGGQGAYNRQRNKLLSEVPRLVGKVFEVQDLGILEICNYFIAQIACTRI